MRTQLVLVGLAVAGLATWWVLRDGWTVDTKSTAPRAGSSAEPHSAIRDGSYVEPFVARIDPLPDPTGQRRELLRQLSRERFGTPRPIVEDRIRRWLDS